MQSPGRLPAPLTPGTLGEDYALRNHLIAHLLFNIRYIEAWNPALSPVEVTGILRMRRWMKQHGLQEPVFVEIGQSFRVTFYGPGEDILDLIPEEGVTNLRELGLNERQIEALRLMVNEGRVLANRDYRELFGVSNKVAANELKALAQQGLAQRIGHGRSTRYADVQGSTRSGSKVHD